MGLRLRGAEWWWPPVVGLAAFGWHLRWLAADTTLPVGDAPGHLINVARHVAWLRGAALPREAFPPGYYAVAAERIELLGPHPDAAAQATALFAGLLAAVLAWLGLRASGPAAAVVAPLAGLAAPSLAAASREVLLDLPATALIVTVWAACWASDGYRRPLPTLLTGLALGVGALVKYTLFPWVLPALVLGGVQMVARSPVSLVPLALVAYPLHQVATVLQARATRVWADERAPELARTLGVQLAAMAAVAAVLLVALGWARRRGRVVRGGEGLESGAWLALAALLSLATIVPWFVHAMPEVWKKVHLEAVAEVRAAGTGVALGYAEALVTRSWPGATWAVPAAAVLELAAVLAWALDRLRARTGGPLGPMPMIAASCLFGAWATARSLPVDVRYYLPLVAGVACLLGFGLTRFRTGPWLAAGVVGVLGWQLAAQVPVGPREAVVLPLAGFDAARTATTSPWGPFSPPRPTSSPLAQALARSLAAAAAVHPGAGAGTLMLVVPGFERARAAGFEDRTLLASLMVAGVEERALLRVGDPPRGPLTWALLVVPAPELASAAAKVPGTLGEPRHAEDVAGWSIRLAPVGVR